LAVCFCEVYSQTDRANTGKEKYYLHKDVNLTYQEILQMKLSEFHSYSDAFKNNKELREADTKVWRGESPICELANK